jgi:hypothetical protein
MWVVTHLVKKACKMRDKFASKTRNPRKIDRGQFDHSTHKFQMRCTALFADAAALPNG